MTQRIRIKRLPDGVEHKVGTIQLKRDALQMDGTFTGYGAVYGNIDDGGDIILPGAFKLSLAKITAQGRRVPMLWQHDAGEPLNAWDEITEDAHGLLCKGRLLNTFERGRQALAMVRAGAVSGLSIGYCATKTLVDEKIVDQHGWPVRQILEADLWEVSVVTFPMNDQARISGIKADAHVTPRDDRAAVVSALETAALYSDLRAIAAR